MRKLSTIKQSVISTAVIITLITSAPIFHAYAKANGATQSGTRQISTQKPALITIDILKVKATAALTLRINSLNKVLSTLKTTTKISTANKTVITTNVQAYLDSLTLLKTKIQEDTDIATVKTDIQSIVSNFRVYAFFLPQIRIIATADRLEIIADKLTALSLKLKTVPNSQTLITDMQSQITAAKTRIDQADTETSSLTLSGYPGNKTILTDAKNKLVSARQALQTAMKDALQLRPIKLSITPKVTGKQLTPTP